MSETTDLPPSLAPATNRPARGTRRRTTAAALATLTALTLAATAVPASAGAPTKVVVRDGVQAGTGWDVQRVVLRSAVPDGRTARVRLVFAETPDAGDEFSLFFDLDDDNRPDARLDAAAQSEWVVRRARGWDDTGRGLNRSGCFGLRQAPRGFMIGVDPHCLAEPDTVRVAVVGINGFGGAATDWAPARRTWSDAVRSFGTG